MRRPADHNKHNGVVVKKELAKQMEGIIQFLVIFIGLLPQDTQAKQKMDIGI